MASNQKADFTLMDPTVLLRGEQLAPLESLGEIVEQEKLHSILLVHGAHSYLQSGAQARLDEIGFRRVVDHVEQARPNPQREDLLASFARCRSKRFDAIVGVGGGSAMDQAKVLHLWLRQQESGKSGSLILIPTCFGSGAEVTPFATVYEGDRKDSIADPAMKADHILLDQSLGFTLTLRHRVIGCLDALCQSVESYWSRRSTQQSREISLRAINTLRDGGWLYDPQHASLSSLMLGGHLSGRAIGIAKTTAAHALSYGLTSCFGVPHGQAVAMVFQRLWPWVLAQIDTESGACAELWVRLEKELGCPLPEFGGVFHRLFEAAGLSQSLEATPDLATQTKLLSLVNPDRLANFPFDLSKAHWASIYEGIWRSEPQRPRQAG